VITIVIMDKNKKLLPLNEPLRARKRRIENSAYSDTCAALSNRGNGASFPGIDIEDTIKTRPAKMKTGPHK